MAQSPTVVLAENLDNTTSTAVVVKRGIYTLSLESDTWGGGSAALQRKSKNGTWIAVANASGTANTVITGLNLSAGEYRILATTAVNVYAYLGLVRY